MEMDKHAYEKELYINVCGTGERQALAYEASGGVPPTIAREAPQIRVRAGQTTLDNLLRCECTRWAQKSKTWRMSSKCTIAHSA